MLFMLKETWPTKSSVAVGKVAVQILSMPLPSYVKMYGPFVTLGGDGIKVYTVYDAEKGHEEEWHKELMKQQTEHFGIEGFKSSVEVVLSVQDALPLVGLSL